MTHDPKQQLSALIDGELEHEPARFLLRRVGADAELRGAWTRYHLAGEILRGRATMPLRSGFAESIGAALDAEPAHALPATAPVRRPLPAALRWAGGAALAASVALAALVVVQPTPAPQEVQAPLAVTAPSQVAPSAVRADDLRPDLSRAAHTVSETRTALAGPAVRLDPRVEGYLIRHNQALAPQANTVLWPYTSVVAQPRVRAQVVTVPAGQP